MFERFTDQAREVTNEAAEAARQWGHSEVTTAHLLYGLTLDRATLAGHVLAKAEVFEDSLSMEMSVVQNLLDLIPRGDADYSKNRDFSKGAKKTLELALREALSLGHNYVGTEHLLLGLLRYSYTTPNDPAFEILSERMGNTAESIRDPIIAELRGAKKPSKRPVILISGNPIEGFTVYGPFDDEETAAAYGEAGDEPWWVAYLVEPT